MIIEVNGEYYNIVNWSSFKKTLLWALGEGIVNSIQGKIMQDSSWLTRNYYKSIKARVIDEDNLEISSDVPYAWFLEVGTVGKEEGVVDPFGEYTRGPNPSRKMPMDKTRGGKELVPSLKEWAKKRGVPEEAEFALAKHIQLHGMKPRAHFRSVLYSDEEMNKIYETLGRNVNKIAEATK